MGSGVAELVPVGAAESDPVRICMLGGFHLVVDGRSVKLPSTAERVVAYLGVTRRPQARVLVARSLWPRHSEQRAVANLRAAVWKLREVRDRVVQLRTDRMGLADGVRVDIVELVHTARQLLSPNLEFGTKLPVPGLLNGLSGDVLPGWDEDWVIFERERVRQLRIHAIEALSCRLRELGRYGEAVEAALTAVEADPLRESAQRVLIEAYLAEGNTVDGFRQYTSYRELLWGSLGVRPSRGLATLVGDEPAVEN